MKVKRENIILGPLLDVHSVISSGAAQSVIQGAGDQTWIDCVQGRLTSGGISQPPKEEIWGTYTQLCSRLYIQGSLLMGSGNHKGCLGSKAAWPNAKQKHYSWY